MTEKSKKTGEFNKPHEVCEVGKSYAVTSGLRLRMYWCR